MSARSNLTNALAFAALVFLLVLLMGRCSPVRAADEVTCRRYSQDVEKVVKQLTNDIDVAQAARDSGFSYCVWSASEPPQIRIETDQALAGTVPADNTTEVVKTPVPVALAPPPSAWVKKCQARYRSFRVEDGTVLLPHRKKRVRCPI